VGVAFSDEGGTLAFARYVIENNSRLLPQIVADAQAKDVSTIVIGESRNFKGEPNTIFPLAAVFGDNLRKAGFTVMFEPEYLTSRQAESIQGKTDMLDASAAALILQSYLDKHHGK
jgi:RNase H-fold protein (predicted Holliday junction resolvase)